jgi:hypothetical protein
MNKFTRMIFPLAGLLLVGSACGIFGNSAAKELSTAVSQAQKEVLPSLEAQLTNVAPTLEAKLTDVAPTLQAGVENLPTEAAGAGEAFTNFSTAPEEILTKIFDRFKSLKSYKENIETFENDQSTGTMQFEVVNPDKVHGNMNVAGKNIEIIMISKTFYVKTGDTWIKADMGMDLEQFILSFEKEMSNMTDMKLIGPDNLDGRPTMVFQYNQKLDTGDSTSKIWVGLIDGYIYQIESNSTTNGKPTRTVVKLSDFNSDITIEPPIQ